MASGLQFDTDSEDELPAGWDERSTEDGKVYYAKYVIPGWSVKLMLFQYDKAEWIAWI